MLKVLSIFGTRPEAIKMAPVVMELKKHSDKISSQVCVTGQHRHMLDQVLELFKIKPDMDLDVMQKNQTPTQVAAAVMSSIEPLLQELRPDWILVQGDTTTVAAASLAAFYNRIKVGHVEAGLRTYNRYHPFPEEINRCVAGVIADLHFAPTATSQNNLLKEAVDANSILVTGNPVIDALNWVAELPFDMDKVGIPLDSKYFILVTAHRRENFGEPIQNICNALKEIANTYGDQIHIVYPVHLNPNIKDVVYPLLSDRPNITLLDPVDYQTLVNLMKHASLVLTDSGGIQEEAPGLGKPVLVLREVTERPEAVEAGTVKIVGTMQERIVDEVRLLLEDPKQYQSMAQAVNPYGDGRASERIVKRLLEIPVEPYHY